MARSKDTYRGARRNACIRELHAVWGPEWYYAEHRNTPRWAIAQGLHTRNNAPIYVPAVGTTRKPSRISDIYRAAKKGDRAGAAKAFFGNKRTTRHATGLGGG